jgi:hypothetical protein
MNDEPLGFISAGKESRNGRYRHRDHTLALTLLGSIGALKHTIRRVVGLITDNSHDRVGNLLLEVGDFFSKFQYCGDVRVKSRSVMMGDHDAARVILDSSLETIVMIKTLSLYLPGREIHHPNR